MRASCRADDSTGTSSAAKPLNYSSNIGHRINKQSINQSNDATKKKPFVTRDVEKTTKDGQMHTGTRTQRDARMYTGM